MRKTLRCALPAAALIAVLAIAAAPAAVADTPPGGMFVFGDGSTAPGATVTFWGAQWWKDNDVSGGRIPPAFKGYALTVDQNTCTFTTVPGNSPPPPDGPLPTTITVAVTDHVWQNGSTISGTVIGFVDVSTGDGYGSDPGHPGTGTVIAGSFRECSSF